MSEEYSRVELDRAINKFIDIDFFHSSFWWIWSLIYFIADLGGYQYLEKIISIMGGMTDFEVN